MMDDRDLMMVAISEARPLDGTLFASGFRGVDTQAKKRALSHVSASQVLSGATVYTTPEHCTRAV
jgi:hypothetical protein